MEVKPIFEFLLWNNCSNNCKFCWQRHLETKHPNKIITEKEKIISINKAKEILKSDTFIKGSHVLLVGGEIFDHPLPNEFYKLVNVICAMQKKNEIEFFYINTNLIYEDLQWLYKFLDIIQILGLFPQLKFTTSYDIVGRFEPETKRQVFLNNLKKIKTKYPDINIVANTILTKQACDAILSNEYNIAEFMDTYNIKVNTIPYVVLHNEYATDKQTTFKTLEYLNKQIPNYLKDYVHNALLNQQRYLYEFYGNPTNDYILSTSDNNPCGHSVNFTKCFKNSDECFECELLNKYGYLDDENEYSINNIEYTKIEQNNIQLQNDWEIMISQIHNVDNFLSLIDQIKTLSKENEYSSWVRWKDINNQVVLKSEKYYYKIYQNDYRSGLYACEIRNKLAELYRNKFGLVWNIATIEKNNILYQIEQREPLQLCTEADITFEEIMLDWSYTLSELEEMLCFDDMLKQIQSNNRFKNVYKLKLIRECVNNYLDYAYTPDKKHVVLLDDTDYFIALLDEQYRWQAIQRSSCVVDTTIGKLYLTPQQIDSIESCIEPIKKWFFMDYNEDPNIQNLTFCSLNEKMLNDNLYILSHQSIPNNLKLYYSKHTNAFEKLLEF